MNFSGSPLFRFGRSLIFLVVFLHFQNAGIFPSLFHCFGLGQFGIFGPQFLGLFGGGRENFFPLHLFGAEKKYSLFKERPNPTNKDKNPPGKQRCKLPKSAKLVKVAKRSFLREKKKCGTYLSWPFWVVWSVLVGIVLVASAIGAMMGLPMEVCYWAFCWDS